MMVTGARLDERLCRHFLFVLVGIVYEAGAAAISRQARAFCASTASAGTRPWWSVRVTPLCL